MNNNTAAWTLKYAVKSYVDICGGIRPCARFFDCNPGIVANVLDGGDSPTLRRLLQVRKHPQRSRLVVDCDKATVTRFDCQRGNLSRREYLDELMDLADGKLPY